MASTGIGETLASAREEHGRDVEDVARSLRLRSEQVRALEEERFDSFGGHVYARGFLKSYALELGLDPQPLLDAYRREVAGDEELPSSALVTPAAGGLRASRSAPPAWVGWAIAAIAVVVGLGVLGQLTGTRTPETASPDVPATPEVNDEDDEDDEDDDGTDDGPATESPEPDPDPEPEPEPEFDGVELLLALEEDSWLRVTIDGTVVLEQVVPAGETLPYNGDDEITVRFGNAGGVRVEMNGQDFGVPGGRGQVEEVTFTPDTEPGDV